MTPQTKLILSTSLIIAIFMTIIVVWNTPSASELRKKERQSMTLNLIKVFVLTFGVTCLTLYFMQDNDTNAMMTNIIKGEPDF